MKIEDGQVEYQVLLEMLPQLLKFAFYTNENDYARGVSVSCPHIHIALHIHTFKCAVFFYPVKKQNISL
jgi:hypothetical protein